MRQSPAIGPHYYKALDNTQPLVVEISLCDAAEKIEALNYGTQRFLSHLVDIRKRLLAEKLQRYRERGDDDVAEYAERAGDPLCEGIEKLLNDGCY